MTIPAILDDLLDYDDLCRRTANTGNTPTYIWVKKGKKEEAWAVCSLLGMVVDDKVTVDGHLVPNAYIFIQRPPGRYTIGVGGRFHLRDLQTYFEQWETDNAIEQSNKPQHPSAYR